MDLTVVVLTLNEERHIARCLESKRGLAKRIVVVDSGSIDQTAGIVRAMGGEVFVHRLLTRLCSSTGRSIRLESEANGSCGSTPTRSSRASWRTNWTERFVQSRIPLAE